MTGSTAARMTAPRQAREAVPEVIDLRRPVDELDDLADSAYEADAHLARLVEREAQRLRVRAAARALVAQEGTGPPEPFDAGLLSEVLARPAEPPYRVAELIPSDAATLIVAQRKTGKTTLLLNLVRSLVTGADLLGRFPVLPVTGRVGLLNYEVSAAQLARWAHEAGVPADRLYLVNLRGRRSPLTLDGRREDLAEQLRQHEVETLIVDPFGRAYTGASQNDPGEVGAWLADLDVFARSEAGARDVILAAHAGWDGERSRGASALEDWADSIVTMVRGDDGYRYLRAEGRDVLVEEDRLTFDAETRTLTLAGAGSRKAATTARNIDDLVPAVVAVVEQSPGISGYKLTEALRTAGVPFHNGDQTKAARLAVDRGLLVSEPGRRNATVYSVPVDVPTYPDLSPPIPGTGATTSPTSLIRGEVAWDRSDRTTSPTLGEVPHQPTRQTWPDENGETA